MRALCRFVKTLLVASAVLAALRYFCQSGHAPEQFQSVCHYSNPAVWDHTFTLHSQLYVEKIRPRLEWVNDMTGMINEEYVAPQIQYLRDKCSDHQCQRITSFLYVKKVYLTERVKFYYNGVIRPNVVAKLIQPYQLDVKWIQWRQKWIQVQYCMLSHIHHMIERIKDITNGRTASGKTPKGTIKVATSPGVTPLASSSSSLSSSVVSSSITVSPGPSSETQSQVEDERHYTEEEYEDAEEGEYEDTIVSTSTILKTVTIHSSSNDTIVSATDNVETPSSEIKDSSKDVMVNEQDVIQAQFDEWTASIENKVKSIISLFDREVTKSVMKLTNATENKLRPEFQSYTQRVETIFRNITSATGDIDCKMELDPTTGQKLYFDKTGTTQLERYVDRELVRDLFTQLTQNTDDITELVHAELDTLMNKVNERVEYLRNDYAEVYQEWANVMVNEWSKRLVYADVVGGVGMDPSINNTDSNIRSDNNWRRFLEVKKLVIDARDELINHQVQLKNVENFVKRVEHTLEILMKENGEFAYILRAKANIAFQQREKEEAELKRQQEEDALRKKQEAELKLKLEQENKNKKSQGQQVAVEFDEKLPDEEAEPIESFQDSETTV